MKTAAIMRQAVRRRTRPAQAIPGSPRNEKASRVDP
jgi:hypothetical protein